VINAVVPVPIMVAVMVAVSKPKIVVGLVLPLRWRLLGWAATAARVNMAS